MRPRRRIQTVLPTRGAPALPLALRRNLLALAPKTHTDMVAAVLRTIFAQPDAAMIAALWGEIRHQLAKSFPKIGPLMDEANAEVLAFRRTALSAVAGSCGNPSFATILDSTGLSDVREWCTTRPGSASLRT